LILASDKLIFCSKIIVESVARSSLWGGVPQMSKRIGIALIEKRLITKEQLTRALQAQLIFGGHLGTNLIEMGFLDEDALGQTLSELHGLPYADAERLRGVHPSVIHAFSRELAEKHHALPIELDDKTLHLAAIDPKMFGDLSSTTGFKIVPWIAPEVRVFEALERYYGIPRRPRYIGICKELDKLILPRSDANGEKSGPEIDSGSINPEAVEKSGPTMDALGVEFGYGRCWTEVAGEIAALDMPSPDRASSNSVATEAAPAQGESTALDELSDHLCASENKEHIGRAVLDHVAQSMPRALLFSVKGNTARLWDWRGLKLGSERAAGLRFPVTTGSVFTLLLGNTHYRGPVPEDAGCRCFYGTLGVEVPAEVLLSPIYLNDRLVAVFYGDTGSGNSLGGETGDYLRLARKISLSLSMLLLKMKLRQV
jgi:hypothetical protein